jgi:hypothetical protein
MHDEQTEQPQTEGTELENRHGWPERTIHCGECDQEVSELETDDSEPNTCNDCRIQRDRAERSRGER